MGLSSRARGACLAILVALLLAGVLPAPAAPARITGRLSESGYSVIALGANGRARSVRARNGRFRILPPSRIVTLHLRAKDGSYAGPIVVGGDSRRAVLGVRAGAELGRILVRRGYARVAEEPAEKWIDDSRWSRARNRIPIGARKFGRVRSRPRPGLVPGDRDLDGIPNVLDIDDDGDRVLDNFESGAGSGVSRAGRRTLAAGQVSPWGPYSGLNLQLSQAANANAAALSAEQIDATLAQQGTLRIHILPGEESELDCSGLTYCAPGGTGQWAYAGPEPAPEFPECCDPDGDGFGALAAAGGFPGDVFIRHGATTQGIATGDVLIKRVTRDGVETQHPSTVQAVLATAAVPVSYNDGQGHAATISYPVAANGPGTAGNGIQVQANGSGDVVLSLTFWRPQRTPIPPETAEWIDIGGLHHIVAVGYVAIPPPLDHAVKDCPPGAYTTADPNLEPVTLSGGTPGGPGELGALRDLTADQPADPANTLSYSVNLTSCFSAWGLTWASGQEREILFRTTNLNDDVFLHMFFQLL